MPGSPARAPRHLQAVAETSIDAIAVPPVFDDVDPALGTSDRLRLEGIVVKDPPPPATCVARRPESWLKVKLTRTQEVVIAGIRSGQGRPQQDLRGRCSSASRTVRACSTPVAWGAGFNGFDAP